MGGKKMNHKNMTLYFAMVQSVFIGPTENIFKKLNKFTKLKKLYTSCKITIKYKNGQ